MWLRQRLHHRPSRHRLFEFFHCRSFTRILMVKDLPETSSRSRFVKVTSSIVKSDDCSPEGMICLVRCDML